MEKDVETIFNKLLSGMVLPAKRYKEPFVLIMSGHVGSGKSTIAKVLSSELSAYIVGGDKIRNIYRTISIFHPGEHRQKHRLK